jgi:hypothetical protein
MKEQEAIKTSEVVELFLEQQCRILEFRGVTDLRGNQFLLLFFFCSWV